MAVSNETPFKLEKRPLSAGVEPGTARSADQHIAYRVPGLQLYYKVDSNKMLNAEINLAPSFSYFQIWWQTSVKDIEVKQC